jgi:hypothetical protein
VTLRYGQIANESWDDLHGWAVGHGLRLQTLTLEEFCHWMWWMLTRNAKNDAERDKLRAKLWRPPVNAVTASKPIDSRSPWSAENETRAFAALKSRVSPETPPA